MRQRPSCWGPIVLGLAAAVLSPIGLAHGDDADKEKRDSSYAPVVIKEEFSAIRERMAKAKPEVMKKQMELLESRYDLRDRPAKGVFMTGGGGKKEVQEGVRVKLKEGTSWDDLAKLSPDE